MSIVRSWLRGLLSASGVTLLVPVGLIAAVAVAATIGGSGLGSVGQLIGGPGVPGDAQQQAAAASDKALPTVPLRHSASRPARAAQRSAPRTATTHKRTPASGHKPATGPAITTQPPTTQTPPPPPPPVTTTTTASQTTTPTPAPPPTETNPIRRLGKVVQAVVKPLPIVGPVAADAVGSIIDLIAPPPKQQTTGP
jgi:hypothetical protein